MSANQPFSGRRTAAKRRKVNLGGRNYDTATGRSRRSGVSHVKPMAKAMAAAIQPPEWMDTQQAKLFCAVRDKVLEHEMVRVTDSFAIELLCADYVQYHALSESIAQDGIMVEEIGARGVIRHKPNPLLYLRENTKKSLRDQFRSFGMTPITRRLVAVTNDAEDDNIDAEGEEWKGVLNS